MGVSNEESIGGRLLVVFDGRCGFCNRAVRWFLRRDRLDRLRFVASESPKIAGLLARQGFAAVDPGKGPGSILVVRNAESSEERVLMQSGAVAVMLAVLPGPWPVVGRVLRWIPRPLRDLGYRLMARWRYRIWGRLENCPLPTAEERARFL
jgi:predicted DCC family thiol-disulfide oxidoreductase YuxK